MKLKSLPEDFQVLEKTEFKTGHGPFALYRLTKKSIGTPEAIQIVLRHWNLSRGQVSYGGLKDRHAVTTQYLTLHQGPNRNIEERSFQLEYLGQANRPFGPHDILANEFQITLRGIAASRLSGLENAFKKIGSTGVVNYFDDQRFGSLGVSGEFIAVPWCQGNYERALYLALAEPNTHDRPREKEQKQILRDHWGQWIRCKELLDRSHRRSIVTYLCDHPQDFRRAIALIRNDLRSLYVAAFQSYLWNRWLSSIIEAALPLESRETISSRCGELWVPRGMSPAVEFLQELELPLPSARQKEWPTAWKSQLDSLLEHLNLDTTQIRLKYPRDTFFSKGERRCWLQVPGLTWKVEEDKQRRGRYTAVLQFELPKGAYATMIVKHFTQVAEEPTIAENEEDCSDPSLKK
ncbi:MAG: tRNA pseudouridine(13) synthase TruD [Pirellulales bacterium]